MAETFYGFKMPPKCVCAPDQLLGSAQRPQAHSWIREGEDEIGWEGRKGRGKKGKKPQTKSLAIRRCHQP